MKRNTNTATMPAPAAPARRPRGPKAAAVVAPTPSLVKPDRRKPAPLAQPAQARLLDVIPAPVTKVKKSLTAPPAAAVPAKTAPKTPAPAKARPQPAKAPAPKPSAAGSKLAQAPTALKVEAPAPRRAKTTPVTAAPNRTAQPVRIIQESILEGGQLWKMSGRHGVAYVSNAALAGELLATEPKNLARAAMAVYYDKKKGKAFAWQVRFDTDRWDEVMRRLA